MKPVFYCLLVVVLVSVCESKIFFQETFAVQESLDRWVQSEVDSENAGRFILGRGNYFADRTASLGLQSEGESKFYVISARFDDVISSTKSKPLVVGCTIRFTKTVSCAGSYFKIWADDIDQKKIVGKTPYLLMFGPDICGASTRKVHAIFGRKGENLELKPTVEPPTDDLTHAYVFAVFPDNTFRIEIDGESKLSGRLSDHWNFPRETLDDPTIEKPAHWDDRVTITDETDTKPVEWDSNPEHVPDSSAEKPSDWDDDLDGDWVPPIIRNPDYKGEWVPKQIPNPDYQGPWISPQIPNPDYDPFMYMTERVAYIGLENWAVTDGIIWDNFIVADTEDEVNDFLAEHWKGFVEKEKQAKKQHDDVHEKSSGYDEFGDFDLHDI